MDYSKLSDDELLKLYNKPKVPTDYSSMSDEELLSRYKGTAQPKNVSTPETNALPKSNPQAVQTPVYPKNGVISGGTSSNSYLDSKGKLHFEGEENNKMSGFDKFKHSIKAVSTNFDEWLNRSAYDKEVQKQKMDIALAVETLPFTFGKTAAWGVSKLANAPIIGKVTQPIINAASKTMSKLPKPVQAIPELAAEGAGWGAFDHGAHKLAGFDNENSLAQDMTTGAIAMPMLAGGIYGSAKLIKAIGNTKPAKAIRNGYNALLNSDTTIGNSIANVQGTLADTLGVDAVNETARKYQKLNRNISKGNTPLTKQFSKSDVDSIEQAKNFTPEQEDLIFDRLKNGDPKKSTTTKTQEEAKEFFDNLLAEEKNLRHAGDDLSHDKSDLDISTPKNDLTHKNDYDALYDKYKIKLPEEKVDDNNYFKKLQREKWNRQIERLEADEAAKTQITRQSYGGRVHVSKNNEPWIAYSKKKKLQAGNAEGSDSGNWYVHETNSKPKQLGADDMYESNVEGIKPTTDEELKKEIAEARKIKQLPSVNKPISTQPRTSEQRHLDKLALEEAQKVWKEKLRTKVKALNSDADSDAKTLGELIYGSPNINKRVSKINTLISDNAGLSDYNYSKINGKRVYTNKRITIKLKDAIKGDNELEKIFKKIGDIDVHIEDIEHRTGAKGKFDYNTNSITIYADCPNYLKTLAHEARHAVQYQLAKHTWFGSRWRKLHESCKLRNKALAEFEKDQNKMAIVRNVRPIYNNLIEGKVTELDFIKTVNQDEAKVFFEHKLLYDRYRKCYLEIDARRFANGEYDKRLFHKGEATIRSELRKTKSTYRGVDKARYGFNDFGEPYSQSRNIGEWSDRLGYERTSNNGRGTKTDKQPDENVQINQPGKQRLADTPQSIIKSIRNASKAQEQTKIEFDIITEGQAANRLKQQSDGEGVYFKQGFSKSDGKIDLTRDYNESRNKKVGHFGEKALEGLGKRGSTREILIETKKEEIRVQHMKDSVNFIESEFAKPIPESGEVKGGYVAVNRNLLANALYGNKSTAWYEMMSKGEEAIRKAFKNEKVANNWIELAKRNSKPDFQLPKQVFDKLFDGSGETVAEYWERYGKDHTGKAMLKTAGAILDAFNNSFKRGVLTSSSFVLNNRFGNQMMIMAKSNPLEYIKSFYGATKLKDNDLPQELIESSILEAVEGYQSRQTYTGWQPLDNFLNLCGGHTIDTSTLKTMKAAADNGLHFKVIKGETVPAKTVESHNIKSLGAEAANICIGLPNKTFNKVCDTLMKFNEAMERFERKQVYNIQMNRVRKDMVKKTGQNMISQEAFLEHLKEHPELEETIIKGIEDTLGDYNNFNKFEKRVLKRIVPFYSWYRTITRHTLTLAKENPARCSMIFLELQRLKDKDQDLKEWQQGSFRTGFYDSRSNKELLINKTAQIPYSTFKEFIDESGKGGLSPAIKKPAEALRGKQFFNNSEITSKRYKKTTKGYGKKAKEGYLDKKTGKFIEGELPLTPRLNYLGKEALETIYPAMRSPLLKPEATIQGLNNLLTDGEYKEPDKLYDSDLGGYNKGDRFLGKEKRYAASDTSTSTKMFNRIIGLSLQNKQPLNKEEREAYKEKIRRQRKRMQGK